MCVRLLPWWTTRSFDIVYRYYSDTGTLSIYFTKVWCVGAAWVAWMQQATKGIWMRGTRRMDAWCMLHGCRVHAKMAVCWCMQATPGLIETTEELGADMLVDYTVDEVGSLWEQQGTLRASWHQRCGVAL